MFEDKIAAINAEVESVPVDMKYEKRIYTVDEIIDILEISKSSAYALVNSGAFHFVKVGGQYRISKKSFDKWLDNMDNELSKSQVCD